MTKLTWRLRQRRQEAHIHLMPVQAFRGFLRYPRPKGESAPQSGPPISRRQFRRSQSVALGAPSSLAVFLSSQSRCRSRLFGNLVSTTFISRPRDRHVARSFWLLAVAWQMTMGGTTQSSQSSGSRRPTRYAKSGCRTCKLVPTDCVDTGSC